MQPFPALLECDNAQPELVNSLTRSGVPVQPYVDREGRLVGVATDDPQTAETRIELLDGGGSIALAIPETISYDANFPAIYEAFSSRGCATLVVTANERPLGYLTCDGFLSMIDPIHALSFAPAGQPTDELSYLVVPSEIAEAADQSPLSAVK